MLKNLLIILAWSILLTTTSFSQPISESTELQDVVANLLAKKVTSCDWYAEVKRTNTWLERDQAERQAFGILYKEAKGKSVDPAKLEEIEVRANAADKVLQAELDDLVRRCGWPTTSGFGEKAPLYAAMIIRHGDLAYQLKYFPVMKAAVTLDELPARFLASTEDRIRMLQEKPQIYGSQLVNGKNPNELVLWPIEDEAHVDERRAQVGMIPVSICAYIRLFQPPVKYERCK
jgi:hypothetical protein